MARDPDVAEGQEQALDPSAYDDPRLKLDMVDGKRVDQIAIRFSGTVKLDRSNPEHVAKWRSLTLGHDVELGELTLGGVVQQKPARQIRDKDGYVGDVAQTVVVKVTDIGGFGNGLASTTEE